MADHIHDNEWLQQWCTEWNLYFLYSGNIDSEERVYMSEGVEYDRLSVFNRFAAEINAQFGNRETASELTTFQKVEILRSEEIERELERRAERRLAVKRAYWTKRIGLLLKKASKIAKRQLAKQQAVVRHLAKKRATQMRAIKKRVFNAHTRNGYWKKVFAIIRRKQLFVHEAGVLKRANKRDRFHKLTESLEAAREAERKAQSQQV
jgi:hypothetical protein